MFIGIELAILLMFVLNDTLRYANVGASSFRPFFRRLVKSHGVRSSGALTQFVVFVVYRHFYTPFKCRYCIVVTRREGGGHRLWDDGQLYVRDTVHVGG